MFFRLNLLAPLFIIALFLQAQPGLARSGDIPAATAAEKRLQASKQHRELQAASLVKNVPFRSIGPVVQSGRVVDIDADPSRPATFYAAYASGGLWRSENDGLTFTPLFDDQPVMTIGDIAVDWKHGSTIWLGSGENNSSRSSYSGVGIFKSSDRGKSWQYMGLPESHHIGRIVLHPDDANTLWVAALGHLYSANPERGVYKSTDGGQSWQKVLYVDENTGAIDLIIDPQNPDLLYAAMWQRTRRAWDFSEGGPGSGIYKSSDGGQSWQLISGPGSGFPCGDGVGRIGLALAPTHPKTVYAFLDNQNTREIKKEDQPAITRQDMLNMSAEHFLTLNRDDVNEFLDHYHFPMEFDADTLFQLVREQNITPRAIAEFINDANARLFDTPVIGAEIYRSEDGGKSWQRTHENYLDKLVYTFGYYFGGIRVAPDVADHIFVLGVPVIESTDGGKTFTSINQENVHVDHHALWINPADSRHLILGNDGGINISHDGGRHWHKANHPAVGQFYTVAVDLAKPYNVYGGLQDNGVWVGPHTHNPDLSWTASGHYAFRSIMGGDGMQVAVDTRDNNTVYTGFQFGNYYRVDRASGRTKKITPENKLGQPALRFNWQTPIHLSVHNQDILYLGSQKVHRSMDKGETWQAISGDLTRGGKSGDVPYGTLTTIHESPKRFGLIYTGSDDGLIHVSRDGGVTWQRISDRLPQNYWVSRVQASAHEEGTVYAALNGYRWDNFESLIYKSSDFGKNWRRIGQDLPAEPVNVIKEDPQTRGLLYVGTDHGLYVSLDGGEHFMAFDNGLPAAPVHDLVIHPRDHDLIVATHGRSLFVAPIEPLQKLSPELRRKELEVFSVAEQKYSAAWGNHTYSWKFNEPDTLTVAFYCRQSGTTRVSLKGEHNFLLWSAEMDSDPGLNYFHYNWAVDRDTFSAYFKSLKKDERELDKLKTADNGLFYLRAGDYKLVFEHAGQTVEKDLKIKEPKKRGRKEKKKIP